MEGNKALSRIVCVGNNNTSLWDTTRWASAGISWFSLISLLIVVNKDVRYDLYIWRREEGRVACPDVLSKCPWSTTSRYYDCGKGVAADMQEVTGLDRLAADQGHVYMQYNLGMINRCRNVPNPLGFRREPQYEAAKSPSGRWANA